MDLLKGIYTSLLLVTFLFTGSYSSQLYLQPQNTEQGYFTNDSFFITCFTTDENIDQLKWTNFDDTVISALDGRIHVQPAEGQQQGLILVFTSVQKDDAGMYTCSDVQDSIRFELIVSRSISFGDTPTIQHAPEGGNGIVICNVRSDARPVVTWYFNKKQIKSEGSDGKYSVLDNHSLEIYNLNRSDAGDYKCRALLITSLATQVKDLDIKLHVQYRPEIIGEQRINYYARMDTEVRLPCNIIADPDPMFQWLRDGMILYNGTDGYTIFTTSNSSTLQFAFTSESQLGEYICRANNARGEEEVNVELKEGEPPLPPTLSIANQNQSDLKLNIEPQTDEELKTTGFKVEYKLASESWDAAEFSEFKIGETYLLRNISFNSEYHIRAASQNLAGYGEFSEPISYTPSRQEPHVTTSSASGIVASSLVLFTSIVFFRLF